MHPMAGTGKRPPLSPQEGWLSDGRQVLHFQPLRYDRWRQALEVTLGEADAQRGAATPEAPQGTDPRAGDQALAFQWSPPAPPRA